DPLLVLQTAVLVRNEENNQVEKFRLVRPLGASALNPHVAVFEDLQAGVIGTYSFATYQITSVSLLEADPLIRAEHYLDGLEARCQGGDGLVMGYNGIRAISLDGAVRQVTWSVGPAGAETTASRNTEHNVWIEPFPVRRRAEFLEAVPRPPQRILDMTDDGAA